MDQGEEERKLALQSHRLFTDSLASCKHGGWSTRVPDPQRFAGPPALCILLSIYEVGWHGTNELIAAKIGRPRQA
eukprot:scaffold318_cov110-Cylindrotheca_fusiformis.AAC.1